MMNLLNPAYVATIANNLPGMQEKQRRLFLGELADRLGYGGISAVAEAFNVSRGMVTRGVQDYKNGEVFHQGDQNRKSGGGRLTIEESYRREMAACGLEEKLLGEVMDIVSIIRNVVDRCSYGDPMTNNVWINVTVQHVADAVREHTGHQYSHGSIKKIIKRLGYSLQKNQKFDQVGPKHPKRHLQYDIIQARIADCIAKGIPVISIDTKCKEKLGDFIRSGREWRRKRDSRRVLDHDFAFKYCQIYPNGSALVPEELMQKAAVVIPYGVYCLNLNSAHVTLGISHDTSEFSADCIANWWNKVGRKAFPKAKQMLVLADGGGSNRVAGFLWKIALQQLADDIGIAIEVCHFAPGCSKHNPIEHRLWSQVSRNWAAKPLTNLEVVRGYVAHTKTSTGLTVSCEINSRVYLTEGQKAEALKNGQQPYGIINSEELQNDLLITSKRRDGTLRKWNYTIRPHAKSKRWTNYSRVALPQAS